ncbi:hypothetical protein BH10BAC1_BH10BAC1_11390 [soil metagenome]
MKNLFRISILSVFITLTSCGDTIIRQTTFDAPFPKRNRDLSNILGNEFSIKSGNDTLNFKIISNKNSNLIINSQTDDTLFYGKVSKFRGLYYFNYKHNDTSYSIHAVKITDSLIYGLTWSWTQNIQTGEEIRKGNYPNLVKYINADTSIIRLHTNKYEMKKMFSTFITQYDPDTILFFKDGKLQETSRLVKENNSFEEMDYVSKVYPNPTKNIINIDLKQKENTTFQLTDTRGKLINEGHLNELQNKIDLTQQPSGIYILRVTNIADKESESVKIIKID